MEENTNLLGDKISKKRGRRSGIEKSIYFTQISCKNFEQFAFDGSRKVNLYNILKDAFNKKNTNYQKKSNSFSFNYKKQNYLLSIIELDTNYCFGRLSTEKQHNDILEEYSTPEEENITYKSVIIKAFTFFYFDISKKALIYIGHKNLKNINAIFVKYFEAYSQERILINYYGEKNLIEKLKKANKTQSISFQLAHNNNIQISLDKVLNWDRNLIPYEIDIKLKKPNNKFLEELLSDKDNLRKIRRPVLKFQDEDFNDTISHLFENYFTVKEFIIVDEVDMKKFENIKDKLISALKNYMSF